MIKSILKTLPGIVFVARLMRSGWVKILRRIFNVFLSWAQRSDARRAILFDALPEQYALALHPDESYLVNTSDKMIGKRLYYRGHFDLQKLETACRLIQKYGDIASDPVLIDAGANIGSICIPAVKRRLVARAIAFELEPDNARLLKVNALLNAVDERIDIRNMAVGAARGQVSVQRSASNFGDHRVLTADQASDMSIDMIPLDSIADDLDLRKTILWMDVQGYEAYALQGARRFMEAGVPLITEFSRAELDSFGCFETFLSVITESGYRIFYDLNSLHPEPVPVSRAALQTLSDRLEQHNTFTDLLFLADSAA